MEKLVNLLIAWIDDGESINGLRLRLDMLRRVFKTTTANYQREEILDALAGEEGENA